MKSNWAVVGTGVTFSIVRERVVNAEVCSPRCSQDDI